jgi:acetamidase/formamidase
MEASLRVRLGFDVIAREDAVSAFGELVGPMAETSEFLVPTGMDEDLDVAMQNCVRAAIALLQARFGMDPRHAYAYLSAATDFDISQVVDLVKGVHARIRKADFA